MAFEEFLRENDQRSVDALKIAAQETLNKLQMTAELKKASTEVQAVKSEIAKTEFLLREYMKYGFFLLKLSPKQWQIQQALKSSSKNNAIIPKILRNASLGSNKREDSIDVVETLASDDYSTARGSQGHVTLPVGESGVRRWDAGVEGEPELYFKEPEELLQVLTELEEQNLTLVQYSQDVDENLEDVNKREKVIRDKINSNIDFLVEHKEMLRANCVREEEKAAELELRSRLFSFGEFNSEHQEKLIDSLSKKINQVYRVCIGDAEVGSLNAVQKLVKVESRLVELSDLIESIPKESVDAIERMKQKERRQKLREEKMKEKQKYQEERLKAALERAVAQPKKKIPPRVSKGAQSLINEILMVDSTQRPTLEQVMEHPWLSQGRKLPPSPSNPAILKIMVNMGYQPYNTWVSMASRRFKDDAMATYLILEYQRTQAVGVGPRSSPCVAQDQRILPGSAPASVPVSCPSLAL
ncbi:Coiled-coil domain-containing protein 38 [Sciurus carolinensis]|uniref:Coiled-coil domain-containing protein 38 n=1 Tax=Sciurus carolinensis TaxID=30640 RepID=A0AA41N3R3_SCICA|nr:Coiled-coil domain-containing protein 38 [Sciurus carolinensis]